MGMRLQSMNVLWKNLQVNIFMVSYRGYGRSEGEPDEKGIKMDAEAVINHLSSREDIDTRRIIVLGRSLGGAVGVHVASRCPPVYGAATHSLRLRLSKPLLTRACLLRQVSKQGAGADIGKHIHEHRGYGARSSFFLAAGYGA